MLCQEKYNQLLQQCDDNSSCHPPTIVSVSSPERLTTSPVRLGDIFKDEGFVSQSSFLLREFDDDLEKGFEKSVCFTPDDNEVQKEPLFFSLKNPLKLNKIKACSLNIPEPEPLLCSPLTPFMSMPMPPPHSQLDDLAEELFAKRHYSEEFDDNLAFSDNDSERDLITNLHDVKHNVKFDTQEEVKVQQPLPQVKVIEVAKEKNTELSDEDDESSDEEFECKPKVKPQLIIRSQSKDIKKNNLAAKVNVKLVNSDKKHDHLTSTTYQCPVCHHQFKKAQQLGGHLSKAHPGQSQKYGAKLARREERSGLRELLKISKELTLRLYPDIDIKKNRFKVNKVRKHISELMSEDTTLTLSQAKDIVFQRSKYEHI